jgi:serine/threonine protein kinase
VITPLPPGSTFAGYQVDAVLAQGGMGVVYLATQQRPGRRIALKLIAPALAADPAYRERFLREVDALASLEHPHVVPIHAAGEWEGQLYLAMRYLDGPDLAEVVRSRGPRSSGCWPRSQTPSTWPTRAASSTATSPRPTSASTHAAPRT